MDSNAMEEANIGELITKYFSYGFQQREILAFLSNLHNICISGRTLKRHLSKLKLYRRKDFSPLRSVVEFIQKELRTSGQLHGYRWMHLRCLQNNLVVTQEIVRDILSLLDPEGCELRKRKRLRRRQYHNKGPNYLWHMDSYDKLKPYGICINGCIDGYSRHIIWMRVGPTSSDPKVVAEYFVSAMRMVGGCPKTLRSDMGTENKIIEHIQRTFHTLFNTDRSEKPPYLYGKSTHNQRIEAWWSMLRKHCSQFWMNLFQSLKDDNDFEGGIIDKLLMQFCFTPIIQEDLNRVILEWNAHKISKSRNSISPTGRPTVLYEIPHLYGTRSYLTPVPSFAVEEISGRCIFQSQICDENFYELCNILMDENQLQRGEDPDSCVELYKGLRRVLRNIFNISD